MNQDFLLKGGAGAARLLVKLSGFCKLNLDPAIIALANTGYADLEDLPVSETDRAAIQNIIDYDFRCILPIQHDRAPELLAQMAKLCGISPIFLISKTGGKDWTVPFAKAGFKFEEDFFVLRPDKLKKTGLENDFIRNRRGGLLIADNLSSSEVSYFAQDFPKTIVVTHRRLITDMGEYINLLFNGAPGDIMTRNALIKRRMETMGFNAQMPPLEFAFMFKIVTEYLSAAEQSTPAPDTGFSLSFNKMQSQAQTQGYCDLDDDLAF